MPEYDVIIAGASFAGLAVAAQLRGARVLLLDPKPVGAGQTSACGTPLRVLRALGLERAILQLHDRLVLHTPGHTFVYPVPEPFCTFDYPLLCQLLYEQTNAMFLQAPALGLVDDHVVNTTQGALRGEVLVDASGWRAALARQVLPGLVQRNHMSFGIETAVGLQDDGLHFWYDPKALLLDGVAWVFPIGGFSRVGIASYGGQSRLGHGLDRFLDRFELGRAWVHGGYFPSRLRQPLAANLFLAGDAAGLCPGLTAEGIRPALVLGTRLGQLLAASLEGRITLQEVRRRYLELIAASRPFYHALAAAQYVLPRLPLALAQAVAWFIEQPAVLRWVAPAYLDAFRLDAPVPAYARR